MNEIWKPVNEFEDKYEVSNFGFVRNIKTKKVLTPGINFGYSHVHLSSPGRGKTMRLHRVVARAFVEGYKEELVVNHLDGNKANNRADNLEWCTQKENEAHAVLHGLKATGTRHGRAKLDPEKVRDIRERIKKKEMFASIAKSYDVNINVITQIRHGLAWRNV